MTEICIAHEVVVCKEINNVLEDELIGCQVSNHYYIKEEVIIIAGSKNNGYTYLDGYKKCNVLDYNLLKALNGSSDFISCTICKKNTEKKEDCKIMSITDEQVIGVIGIQRINDFTGLDNVSLSVEFIENYNQEVKGKLRAIDTVIKTGAYCRVKK